MVSWKTFFFFVDMFSGDMLIFGGGITGWCLVILDQNEQHKCGVGEIGVSVQLHMLKENDPLGTFQVSFLIFGG